MALAWVRDDPGASSPRLGTAHTRCKSWRCAGCGRWRRALHAQLIDAGFAYHRTRGEPFARFVTVTWPTDTGARLSVAADCANTTRMFRLWVEDVRRHYRPALQYYVVKEPTPSRGRIHLHAITFGPYLPKCSARRLPAGCILGCGPDCKRPGCHQAGGCIAEGRPPCVQALAWRRGLGFLDLRVVRGQRHAAAYIAKYLSKDHVGKPWPRYSRRCTYSHDFAPTTIAALSESWGARAYAEGVKAGHIVPDPDAGDGFTRWRLLRDLIRRGPPAAWLTIGPMVDRATGEIMQTPTVELSEVAAIRRSNRLTEAEARLIAPDVADLPPGTRRLVYTEAAHRTRAAR